MAEAPRLLGQGSVSLDDAIFGERFHESLVHETVRAELAARRRGTASTRTRAEVSMTGAKAWRQKGTGRARAGALSVPHRTGGGVAFGPKPRSHTVKVNRKARRRALRGALSLHATRGSLAVLDAARFGVPYTKAATDVVGALAGEGRVLLVLADGEENAVKSFRNIAQVSVLHVDDVGVADIVGAARLVVSDAALDRLVALAAPPSRGGAE